MNRRWIAPVLLLAFAALLAPGLSADDKTPDATIRLSEGSVAAGIGWNWGKGTFRSGTLRPHSGASADEDPR